MQKRKNKILAIDPGTRYIGVAVFNGKELSYYDVKTIQQRKSPHELLTEGRKIIRMLLEDFRPETLVVEKTMFANIKGSATLNKFTDEIIKIGRKRRLRTHTLSANTVRKRICGNGWASKQDVAREIVARFPELKPYASSDRRWKEEFFYNMFDAVAVGVAVAKRKGSAFQ